jgi:hypothetical protein
MNRLSIELKEPIDQEIIDAGISSGHFYVDVMNRYSAQLAPEYVVDLAEDFSVDELNAFKKVIDRITYYQQEDAVVWVLKRDAKVFSLSSSYVRSGVNTKDLNELNDGVALILNIETDGFLSTHSKQLSLWYNQAFNSVELEELKMIGIDITGNGRSFTIANTQELRITLMRPNGVSLVYLFNADENDLIVVV